MSKASRRKAALVRAGYSSTLLDRLAREGTISAAPYSWTGPARPLHPLAMVNRPETGRTHQRVPLVKTELTFHGAWVADDAHPLGGYLGTVVLHRRVNLRKDEMPRWVKDRPLYEFTKESGS